MILGVLFNFLTVVKRKRSLSKFLPTPKSISDENKVHPEATISIKTCRGRQEVPAEPDSVGPAGPAQWPSPLTLPAGSRGPSTGPCPPPHTTLRLQKARFKPGSLRRPPTLPAPALASPITPALHHALPAFSPHPLLASLPSRANSSLKTTTSTISL